MCQIKIPFSLFYCTNVYKIVPKTKTDSETNGKRTDHIFVECNITEVEF